MNPPKWLGKLAKAKWRELLAALPPLAEDGDALALLCQSWQNYLLAQADIATNGQVERPPNGGMSRLNPACKVANDSWKEIVALSKHFGLMPEPKSGADDGGELQY